MSEYVTCISTANDPSHFKTSFDTPFNLSDGYEVALTNIFYGPLCNVCESNDLLVIRKNNTVSKEFHIPHGFYPSKHDLLTVIHQVIVNFYDNLEPEDPDWDKNNLYNIKKTITASRQGISNHLTVELPAGVKFYHVDAYHGKANVLQLFGIKYSFSQAKISVKDEPLDFKHQVGFLYSSLVQNSKINDKSSRLLGVFPMVADIGYSEFVITNPAYYPIAVNTFQEIEFHLRDYKGATIKISSKKLDDYFYGENPQTEVFPTILQIHIRKRISL